MTTAPGLLRIRLCFWALAALGFLFPGPCRSQGLSDRWINNARQPWLDNRGKPLDAHGAGLMEFRGVFYLYGEIKEAPTWHLGGQKWESYRVPAGGISCYGSTDLVHWKFRGVALAPVHDPSSDLDTGKVIERPKVVLNPVTGKFVMWMHVDDRTYHEARAGVAVSDRPEGPFHYLGSFRPNGAESRDLTLFQDRDGKAYLVFASENNTTLHIQPLSPDYLRPAPGFQRILIGQKREAPAVFAWAGKYYLITSLCSGWDPNAAAWAVSDRMMGTWKQQGNPCRGKDSAVTYFAQGAFVIPLPGRPGKFLFGADRWNKKDLRDSRYLWLPLDMEASGPVIRYAEHWHPFPPEIMRKTRGGQ